MRILALMLICVGITGCKERSSPVSIHDQRQAALNEIADKCGIPRTSLKLEGSDELHMQPPAGAKYESVDCMLSEVKKSGFPLKIGFVGNEYYSNEMDQ